MGLDLSQEWICFEKAMNMMAATPDDLHRLIRMRRLTHRESDNAVRVDDIIAILELREFDAVLNSGGTEKEARRRAESLRTKLQTQFSTPSPSEGHPAQGSSASDFISVTPTQLPSIQNPKSQIQSLSRAQSRDPKSTVFFDGLEWVSRKEACRCLGITENHLDRLLKDRLNSELRNNRRWILKEDVESYARLQQIWDNKGGRWTPYGRQEKGARDAGPQPWIPSERTSVTSPAPNTQHSNPIHPITQSPNHSIPYWLRSQEAAQILNISNWHLHRLAKKQGLTRVRGNRPGPGKNYIRPRGSTPTWFLMEEIARLQQMRESRGAGISPARWNHDLRHPVIRTALEAPPNDELIPTAEAARILSVKPLRIYNLVLQGKLFGWQKEPGKSGCRLWLSLNQVCRYARDPQRLKFRSAFEKQRRDGCGSLVEWEDYGIAEYYRRLPSKSTKRDRGEYFTTRQAAIVLKIGPQAVRMLRERGPIHGYRRPVKKGMRMSPRAWWYFKKEDIFNLLADHNYRRDRKEQSGIAPDMGRLE